MAAFAIAAARRSFYDPDPVMQRVPRPRCCYCKCRMVRPKGAHLKDAAETRDHIRPRAWNGDNDPTNFRRCCYRCNLLRAECGHCVGALACARAVASDTGRSPRQVIRHWRFRFAPRPASTNSAAGRASIAPQRSRPKDALKSENENVDHG